MKKYFYLVALFALGACFQAPEGDAVGFLSNDIYLKGQDTIFLALGSKGETDVAWLDDSTLPVLFSIENIRDKNGNRSEQFFRESLYRTWSSSYNVATDTTEAQVRAKLVDLPMQPLSINSTNGRLLWVELSKDLSLQGDVYNVDVRVTNSAGSKVIKDYAVVKLSGESRPFTIFEVINGIAIPFNGNQFVYYDRIQQDAADVPYFFERRQNIYDNNGIEDFRIHKISDEPTEGIRFILRLEDEKGRMYPPDRYITQPGLYSYIDVGLNRENTERGMELYFPTTPWPAFLNSGEFFFNYLMGPTYTDLSMIDLARLRDDLTSGKLPGYMTLCAPNRWEPEFDNWTTATSWFVRLRSRVRFEDTGTWQFTMRVPYTSIDGNFD